MKKPESVRDGIRDQALSPRWILNVDTRIWYRVWNQVGLQVQDQVRLQVQDQVWEQVNEEV